MFNSKILYCGGIRNDVWKIVKEPMDKQNSKEYRHKQGLTQKNIV